MGPAYIPRVYTRGCLEMKGSHVYTLGIYECIRQKLLGLHPSTICLSFLILDDAQRPTYTRAVETKLLVCMHI
jgi:hypothetical protein